MTIALPIEVKNREYLSKLYLASKILLKTNYNIILGEKNKVYSLYKHNNNIFLLSKGGSIKRFKFYKNNKLNSKYLGVLDEEGPIHNLIKYQKNTRLHKDILKNLDEYFIWGNQDYIENKKFFLNFKNKFIISGHPKFDLLKKNQSKSFNSNVKKIKKKFSKYILISSNFIFDTVFKEDLYYKYTFSNFLGNGINNNKRIYFKRRKVEIINYKNLIKLSKDIAKNNPNYDIIFRPHPNQSLEKVRKRFGKIPKNLKIVFYDTITPWIIGCELFIHSGCTTFLEASTLNKRIIYFNENHTKSLRSKMFYKIGYYLKDYSKCLKFINLNANNNFKFIKKSRRPTQFIHNSGEKNFSDIFINLINNKYKRKLKNKNKYIIFKDNKNQISLKTKSLLSKIKNFIISKQIFIYFTKFFKPDFLLTKAYKKNKFDNLKKSNLSSDLSKLIIKSKFRIYELDENLFLITKNKS